MVGCNSSSSSGGESRLVVQNFNQNLLPGVMINSPLVFTFSADVDPATVNSNTIQIWTTIDSKRHDAAGVFEVSGRTVTWYPQMTSKIYPLDVQQSNTTPIMPSDSGMNTFASNNMSYAVLMQASPNPNTVKSVSGAPLLEAFSSTFDTIQGPVINTPGNSQVVTGIFDAKAPYFRNTIRVADVLAYGGTLVPPTGFRGWLLNPVSSGGENPMFIAPGFLTDSINGAMADWTNLDRDRTGELVDGLFGIQLVPALSALDMANNVFNPSGPQDDERFISNLQGQQQGRGRVVDGLNIYFTQELGCDSFLDSNGNPKTYNTTPFEVKVLPTAGTDPTPLPEQEFTLTFVNNTQAHAALVNLTLKSVVKTGWIYLRVVAGDVRGMPGGRLENNFLEDFYFIWPAKINAQ